MFHSRWPVIAASRRRPVTFGHGGGACASEPVALCTCRGDNLRSLTPNLALLLPLEFLTRTSNKDVRATACFLRSCVARILFTPALLGRNIARDARKFTVSRGKVRARVNPSAGKNIREKWKCMWTLIGACDLSAERVTLF